MRSFTIISLSWLTNFLFIIPSIGLPFLMHQYIAGKNSNFYRRLHSHPSLSSNLLLWWLKLFPKSFSLPSDFPTGITDHLSLYILQSFFQSTDQWGNIFRYIPVWDIVLRTLAWIRLMRKWRENTHLKWQGKMKMRKMKHQEYTVYSPTAWMRLNPISIIRPPPPSKQSIHGNILFTKSWREDERKGKTTSNSLLLHLIYLSLRWKSVFHGQASFTTVLTKTVSRSTATQLAIHHATKRPRTKATRQRPREQRASWRTFSMSSLCFVAGRTGSYRCSPAIRISHCAEIIAYRCDITVMAAIRWFVLRCQRPGAVVATPFIRNSSFGVLSISADFLLLFGFPTLGARFFWSIVLTF